MTGKFKEANFKLAWINLKFLVRLKNTKMTSKKITSRQYRINKLIEFNQSPDFDIEKTHLPKNFLEQIKIYFPIILIMIILLYCVLVFTFLSSFNPIVIYTIYS